MTANGDKRCTILGVDAGGTACRARLADAAGRTLGAGTAGPASTRLGAAAVVAAIRAAAEGAAGQAGRPLTTFLQTGAGVFACVGLAGISRREVLRQIRSHEFFAPFADCRFVSDALIAHCGAHAAGPGGTVVVGTGSVAVRGDDPAVPAAGGHGFPVSDLGSGAHVGLLAAQAYLRTRDGLLAPGPLAEALARRLGEGPATATPFDGWDATEFAALAPAVFESAGRGDAVAADILRTAAACIVELCEAAAPAGTRLCLVGGMAAPLLPWLPAGLAGRISPADGDALDGALRLARQRCRRIAAAAGRR